MYKNSQTIREYSNIGKTCQMETCVTPFVDTMTAKGRTRKTICSIRCIIPQGYCKKMFTDCKLKPCDTCYFKSSAFLIALPGWEVSNWTFYTLSDTGMILKLFSMPVDNMA